MTILILGLVVFIGVHSVRIFAEGWRQRQIAGRGELSWKAMYSIASIAGFILIVYGYGEARTAAVDLWHPPHWLNWPAAILMLAAIVLLVAAYVPGNALKARMRHPMILGVKTWALAHLLTNGRLADVVLFGAFLAWAILDFRAARVRDRAAGVTAATGATVPTAITLVVGVIAWYVFARYLHAPLIGVAPFGGA